MKQDQILLEHKCSWYGAINNLPLDNNMTNACFDDVYQGSAYYHVLGPDKKKRWYVSWHFVVVMSVISLEYCFRLLFFLFFPLCTYCVNSNVLIEGQDTLALWGQSQLYRHSRRLCNGRFDWDTVFPDEGTSFQNHVWQASRESFTESVLLFTRTGGTKQGAECVWLCYHWNEEWGGGYYVRTLKQQHLFTDCKSLLVQ